MSESEAVHSDYKNCEEAENVQRLSSFCTIMNNKVPCQKDSKATRKRAIEDAILKWYVWNKMAILDPMEALMKNR